MVTAHKNMFGEVILPIPLRKVLHYNSQEKKPKQTSFIKQRICYGHNWDAHALVPRDPVLHCYSSVFLCMHKHFLPRYTPWPVMAHAVTPQAHGLKAWVLSRTGKGLSESNIPCSESRPPYRGNICFAKLISLMPEEHLCYQHKLCHSRGTSLAP